MAAFDYLAIDVEGRERQGLLDAARRILESLGFTVGEGWQVTCPLRRHDIEGPADIVEEVVRIHGLDKVASVALPRMEGVARPTATPQQ